MSVLAYWDIRGLGQPLRLLLNYVGEDFEDRQFACGPAPDYDKSCWMDVKFKLGLDFPNLPYYIDGDIKITETNAILRHIARKHNLCGSTTQEQIRVDMMHELSMDFRNGFVRLCYNPKFNELKADYLKNVVSKLDAFEKFLGDNKFFAGENVTLADFHIYEMLDQHLIMESSILNNYPKLKAFHDRFEALPQIKKYMDSDKFMKSPLNNKMAGFVG